MMRTGTYTEWSPELDAELARQWLGGLTSREIAAAMGRTTSSIQTQASKLGLPRKLAGPAGKHDGRDRRRNQAGRQAAGMHVLQRKSSGRKGGTTACANHAVPRLDVNSFSPNAV